MILTDNLIKFKIIFEIHDRMTDLGMRAAKIDQILFKYTICFTNSLYIKIIIIRT